MSLRRSYTFCAPAIVVIAALSIIGCNGDSGSPGDTWSGVDPGPPDGGNVIPKELEPFTPPDTNVLIGQVVSADGIPLQGATAQVGEGDAAKTATTNYDGYYYLEPTPAERLVVRFTAPGYTTVTRTAALLADGKATVNAVLMRQATSVAVTPGETVPVSRGTVMVPEGAAVDAEGNAVSDLRVRVTPIDVTNKELQAAPGDFSARPLAGGEAQLETFGMAEYQLTDADGNPLKIKEGEKVRIELLLPEDTDLKEGDVVPAWHFDAETGQWVEEGEGTVQKYTQDEARLSFATEVGHFSWWNCDKEMETTCVRGVVKSCDGKPVSGADVQINGVDYDGTSSAYGGTDGTFCAPARRGSTVQVFAASGWGANRLVAMKEITTADIQSTCGEGPCDEVEIVLPCTPEESDFDCDDIYFAGCKGCAKGKVENSEGAPVQYATIKVTTGATSFTVMTDKDGGWCAPAAIDSAATIVANGPQGGIGVTSVTPTKAGQCPDCDEAPTITLQEQQSQTDSDLDFTPCLQDLGGVTIDSVMADGAAANVMKLDGGWAAARRTADSDGGVRLSFDLNLLPADTTTDLVGRPSATISMELEEPLSGGITIPVHGSDGPRLRGELSSAIGSVKGLGNETYELDSDDDGVGSGSITFESGFTAVGDAARGTFDFTFTSRCAPMGASVRVRGSFDTTVTDLSTLPSFDVESDAYKSWICSWYGFYIAFADLDTWWNGQVVAELDGQPIPVDPDTSLTGTATYSWEQDQLRINYYGMEVTAFLSVDDVVSGPNPITNGSLFIDGQNCYYQVSTGEAVVQDYAGAANDTWFTGSFDMSLEPASGSDPVCKPHTVSGQFGAPVCRE